jgi:amino-acid N-acetyltransferase
MLKMARKSKQNRGEFSSFFCYNHPMSDAKQPGPDMNLIREAFHYQSRFAGSTMVFKIDFPVTCESGFPSLMKDLALLAGTGFKVVIVPGAKEWIDSVLAEYDIETRYVTPPPSASAGFGGALRLTGEDAMPFLEMAAFHVATRFMTALSSSRVDSVIGNFVRARGLGVLNGVDMERTGTVEKILTKPISRILDLGIIPILPCVGWGPSGKSYNVPGDEIALQAASALGAVKLFIVSAGKALDAGNRLTPAEAEALLSRPVENTGVTGAAGDKGRAELRLALAAVKAGVERVHIIDGREEGAVLRELFSNLGSGTMVYADEYEAVRPLKTSDIPDILRIMEPLVSRGALIRRTTEDILDKKEDYFVFGIDGSAHASGALHCFGNEGEIAAVAVDAAYADMGLGRRIVSFLINKAKKDGLRRVFVLTTQTQDWFEALGFTERGPDCLPPERRKTYNTGRNSKVFALEL